MQGAMPVTATELQASIIVVTHNGGGTVSDCLSSIKGLLNTRFELIVVDNASEDDTVNQVLTRFPEARILRLARNMGYGAGCNAGAKIAKGEILIFLNQDVSLDQRFSDRIVSEMVRDNTIGLCGGKILSWDGNWLVSAGQAFERWTGYGLDLGFGSSSKTLENVKSEVFSPNGAAFAARRDVFQTIGGFDETLFLYFDETDLAWRARIAGFRVVCRHDATVRHQIDPRRAHRVASRYYIDRNSLLCEARNYELRNAAVFLPTSVMVRLIGIIFLTLLGRGEHARSTARALNDFFALIPRTWKCRQLVRSIRKLPDREVMRKDLLLSPRDVLAVFRTSFLPHTSQVGSKV